MIKNIKFTILLALITLITFSAFTAMYFFDNKYTFPHTNNEYTGDSEVIFLVDGWDIYENKLLTPNDFKSKKLLPDKHIYIGEYTGFEFGDKTKNPHGSATYRINVKLPEDKQIYTLELPEIFSSYYIYINGVLETHSGNPSPKNYKDITQNKTVNFSAGGNAEIIIGVTDHSHYYSGLIYPPAFGTRVTELLNIRLFFRSLFVFVPFSIGIIYLCFGLLIKEKKYTVHFFLLCLFFIGYTCYPLFHTFFASSIRPWYIIESFCYFAFIYTVVRIHGMICHIRDRVWNIFRGISGVMCIISVIYPLFMLKDSLGYMYAYSFVIGMYKYIIFTYLIISSFIASRKKNINAKALFTGLLIFGYSLLADRLFPMFEPIYLGWFTEIAGFIIVCITGGIICVESIHTYRQNSVLRESIDNSEKLIDMQKELYFAIRDRIEETKKTSHDLRHNLLLIQSYAEDGKNDQIIDFINKYVESIKGTSDIILCKNSTVNSILAYYTMIAQKYTIKTEIHISLPEELPFSDSDLCIIFGNLMENAVEACKRINFGSFIVVRAKIINNSTIITVDNSFDGNTLPYGNTFLSSKRNGQKGIGISSIQAITHKYNGNATFEADCKNMIFKASVILNHI